MRGLHNAITGMIKAIKDKIGNTNISTIGDGTVTGAISTINSNLSSQSVLSAATTPFLKGSTSGEVEAYSFTASYAGELMAEVYFASLTSYMSMSITVNGYHMDMYGIAASTSNPVTYHTTAIKATFNKGDVVKVLTRCDTNGTLPTMNLHFRKAY